MDTNKPSDLLNTVLPFERSYWIIPGKLLAGEYPSAVSEEHRKNKLQGLINMKIKSIINLTEEFESNHNGIKLYDYEPDFNAAGIQVHRKAIRDLSVPSIPLMDEIISLIYEQVENDKPLYFHCWGGIGRTGTVLGCYLLHSGMASISNVFEYINYLKRTTSIATKSSPETEEQKDFIRNYSKYIDKKRENR